jgi:2-methylcitrate dehydratase PrpD
MSMHIKTGDGPSLTQQFTQFIVDQQFKDLSQEAIHSAKRGVLDWLGCALAASHHPSVKPLIEVLQDNDSSPQSTVLGQSFKLSHLDAPLVNGQMGHLLDFDDTHMGGVVLHASSPTLSALISESERQKSSGQDFLLAYICGFEAGVRVGQSAPNHHAQGWHLTGTLGHFAASVAVGKLLKLDPQQLTYAMGIAGTQASGMQQNRGTSCKSFHAGRAGSNGLLSARLALKGFNSSEEIIDGKRGFSRIYSQQSLPEKMIQGLGLSWEIERNGFKPYACGVVIHPAIDAMIEFHKQRSFDVHQVRKIEVYVNPIVLSITGTVSPETGLHSKFSIYHSVAVALVEGRAGIEQYTDLKASDPVVTKIRDLITINSDENLGRDQARAIIYWDHDQKEVAIEHALGTVQHPLSDRELEEKFIANAKICLTESTAKQLIEHIWHLDELPSIQPLLDLCQG